MALSRDYAARQRVSLVGQKVSSIEDLAVLAQAYGDPMLETFHAIFGDNDNKAGIHCRQWTTDFNRRLRSEASLR
jgi:hypothetical protein